MYTTQNKLSIAERLTSPTPKLFQLIATLGGILTVLSAGVMNWPVDVYGPAPEWIAWLGNWAGMLAGMLTSLVSFLTVDFGKLRAKKQLDSVGK